MGVGLISQTMVETSDENLKRFLEAMLQSKFNVNMEYELGRFRIVNDKLMIKSPMEESYDYHNNFYKDYILVEVKEELQKYKYLVMYLIGLKEDIK